MVDIITREFARPAWRFWPARAIRAVTWNIERGLKLPQIIDFLSMQKADVLFLQEVDLNARRTARRNIAEEIAQKLEMNYAFAWEFQELAEGSNREHAYTGQATLSRWPIANPAAIRFRIQSSFWQPRWWIPDAPPFQARIGGRIALRTRIAVPGACLIAYNTHLESRGPDTLRNGQLCEILADANRVPAQSITLVSGDLNLDLRQNTRAFEEAGFQDAIGTPEVPTTTRRGLFNAGSSKDWAMVRGAVRASGGKVDRSVHASDHYPLVFDIEPC